jgi:glycosyltransferase involved in cell wall biosynthesis
MDTRKTQISVITPLYHGEKYLQTLVPMIAEAVKMLHDKFSDCGVEYILVNDSPDSNIKETVLNLAHSHSGLKVIFLENEKNQGIHASRVNGLLRAEGEYIYFLDQDDRISKEALYLLYAAAQKNPKASVTVANGYRQYPDLKKSLYTRNAALRLTSCKKMYLYGTDMIFSPGQCLIKKADIPKEWKENIMYTNGSDDFYLWLLMLENHCCFSHINHHIYYHMETEENFSGSFEKMCASYEEMCSLLADNRLYPKKNVKILRRRLNLKKALKGDAHGAKRLLCVLKNPDVVIMTVWYKMAGYH